MSLFRLSPIRRIIRAKSIFDLDKFAVSVWVKLPVLRLKWRKFEQIQWVRNWLSRDRLELHGDMRRGRFVIEGHDLPFLRLQQHRAHQLVVQCVP